PLDAVELAVTARLDDPVGVEHDGAADIQCRPHLLVVLARFDPEHQPEDIQPRHRSVSPDDSRRWMSRTGRSDFTLAAVDEHVDERDELARSNLPDDDLVRRLQEIARPRMLTGKRAEDELRHGHVRRGFDAVPGYVAESDGKPAVAELHEVVDVTTHLDVRRRL